MSLEGTDSGLTLMCIPDLRCQWFEQKKSYLDSLESQMKGWIKSVEVASKHRLGEHKSRLTHLLHVDGGPL